MWKSLEVGVDRFAKLTDFWGDEVVTQIVDGADSFTVWGVPQGYGELAGVLYETLVIPEAVGNVLQGTQTSAEAAASVQERVQAELDTIAAD
jgi:multiple sugar transport system substrate-binding protein